MKPVPNGLSAALQTLVTANVDSRCEWVLIDGVIYGLDIKPQTPNQYGKVNGEQQHEILYYNTLPYPVIVTMLLFTLLVQTNILLQNVIFYCRMLYP